jgi:hypothetical protein
LWLSHPQTLPRTCDYQPPGVKCGNSPENSLKV